MKKHLLYALLIPFLSTVFVACKKEGSVQPNPLAPHAASAAREVNPAEIGSMHNECLAYCYSKFAALNQPYSLTMEERFAKAKEYCAAYFDAHADFGMSQQEITDFFNNQLPSSAQALQNYQTDQSDRISALLNNFSGLKKTIVSGIFSAVDSAATSSDLATRLSSVLAQGSSLPQADQTELASYASVAQKSWQYWIDESEFAAWETLFTQPGTSHRSRMDIFKATVKGDCEGAVTGALAGGLAGALIGAPLGSAWECIWSI